MKTTSDEVFGNLVKPILWALLIASVGRNRLEADVDATHIEATISSAATVVAPNDEITISLRFKIPSDQLIVVQTQSAAFGTTAIFETDVPREMKAISDWEGEAPQFERRATRDTLGTFSVREMECYRGEKTFTRRFKAIKEGSGQMVVSFEFQLFKDNGGKKAAAASMPPSKLSCALQFNVAKNAIGGAANSATATAYYVPMSREDWDWWTLESFGLLSHPTEIKWPEYILEMNHEYYYGQRTALTLEFFDNYPSDPRRWRAVYMLLHEWPWFLKAPMPDVDPKLKGLDMVKALDKLEDQYIDLDAKAKFRTRIMAIAAAMLLAPDVDAKDSEYVQRITSVIWGLQDRQRAILDGRPADMAGLNARFDAYCDRFRQLGETVGQTTSMYLADLGKYSLQDAASESEHLLSSDIASVRNAAVNYEKMQAMGKNKTPVELKFTSIDGRSVDIADLRGKVVLIDFWATWCHPCVAEMPNVKAVYDKYHSVGFEVIGIDCDSEGKQGVLDFLKLHEYPWPQYYDGNGTSNKVAVQYGVDSWPTTLLVGKDGVIAESNARGPKLEPAVRRLLGLSD
jgi:thiol-disulfide isomerase/thioredoxin